MTQQEKLIALLREMKLPFEERTHEGQHLVKLEAEMGHPRLDGYSGFVCQFAFNPAGGLVKATIAE